VTANLPLLVSHDRDKPPAGVVRSAFITVYGLGVEGELIGSDDELQGWRRRFAEGLHSGLSIGFSRDRHRDVYEKPHRPGGLPVVRPRDVTIHEFSTVQWPAYPSAGVVSLSVRTADLEDLHERSEQVIAWWEERKARKRGQEILKAKTNTEKR
jgi:phage head maturation protease